MVDSAWLFTKDKYSDITSMWNIQLFGNWLILKYLALGLQNENLIF